MAKENSTKDSKIKNAPKVRNAPDPALLAQNPDAYSLDRDIFFFYMNEPFLATVASSIIRREDWDVPTAYIGYSPETQSLRLGYNPDFMRQLTSEQRQSVLKHEFYHAIFLHVMERAPAESKYAQLWNVAADLAINSIICESDRDKLPKFCLLPGEFPLNCQDQTLGKLIESFPKMESADWYMDRLQEYAESKGVGADEFCVMIGADGDGQTLDSHGQWGDLPEEMKELVRQKVFEAMGDAMKKCQNSNQWGTVPQSVRNEIQKMLTHVVDWKSILRLFAGRCRSLESFSTVKKLNRKLPYKFPGTRRDVTARLLWAIDQSGSMDDESVQRGLAEGFACSKISEMDIVNFDTEIDDASFRTVSKGKGFKWERTRCGGTDFNCVMRYVNHQKNSGKWTGVVIVTDGYAPKMGRMRGVKTLWLVTPDGSMDAIRESDLIVKMDAPKKLMKK